MDDLERHPLDSFSLKRAPVVLGLLIIGGVFRFLLVRFFENSPHTAAEEMFVALGENWVGTYSLLLSGQPTASAMPGYPILLGLQKWFYPDSWQPILGVQIVLGTLSAWLGGRIAWKVFRRPVAFWAAFPILLFHPAYAALCGRLEPLSLGTFLLLLGVWLLAFNFRPTLHLLWFLMAAFVFSATLYFSLQPLAAIPILALGIGFLSHDRMVGVLGGVAVCLALLVSLMPWMGRNLIVMGTYIPLTTSLPVELESALIQRVEPTSVRVKVATGEGEIEDYRRSLSRLPSEFGRIGFGDWLGIGSGAFTQWWSDYPILFEKIHSPPRLWVRVLLFTLGFTLFFLALIGILPTLNSGRTWVFLIALGVVGLQHSLFALPAYRHLIAFPILALFAARGADQIAILFTKSWRSTPPEAPPPTPTWVSENEYTFEDPYLEPIKGPRKGEAEKEGNEPGRLGPLF